MLREDLNQRQAKNDRALTPRWMSLIFGSDAPLKEPLGKEEEKKIELFEKGLASELSGSDTIDQSFRKIVRMALAAEFGPSFVKARGAKSMIDTIVRGITGDSELRKQALLIVDRFSSDE